MTNDPKLEEALRGAFKSIKKLQTRLDAYAEPIAIVGMGCRFPGGGNSPEEFWNVLEKGKDGISEIPKDRFDVDAYYDRTFDVPGKMYTRHGGFLNVPVDEFDAAFFRISPVEAGEMDPQQRLLLEVTWEALENANIAPDSLMDSDTGIFVGMMNFDYSQLIIGLKGIEGVSSFFGSGNAFSAAVGRVSFVLGLKGPCMAVDTACSSSLVAINSACESLHLGHCQQAIAGGVSLMLSPEPFVGASQAHMLSPDGHCKTFDQSADGYARAEGCGMLVLKRLQDAKRDGDTVYAMIRSSGVNQGGATSGLTVPNGNAQEVLIRRVCSEGGLKVDDIDYIEAHGTGTSLGDPIEFGAISDTFGKRDPKRPLLIGSVKSNIGHTEGAAGVAGVIKTILSLNHELIPANLKFTKLNPHIELDFPVNIVTKNTPWLKGERIRRAGVSSFGFSGINAHVIIEEAPPLPSDENLPERPCHLVTLSGKTEKALKDSLLRFEQYLSQTKENLRDIAYATNVGRTHFKHRVAIVAKTTEELEQKLREKNFISSTAEVQNEFDSKIAMTQSVDCHELAKDYVKGARVDWEAFHAPYKKRKVPLPTYPFQRKRYWLDFPTPSKKRVYITPTPEQLMRLLQAIEAGEASADKIFNYFQEN